MLFNSLSFIIFFTIVCIIYFNLAQRGQLWLLLIASCFFYMWFIPIYILVLFLAIIIDYYAAIRIAGSVNDKTRKKWLYISIISTCLILFVFKYFNFFVDNFDKLFYAIGIRGGKYVLQIALPIGISFHTFQSLSYVIEVYRKNQKVEKDFLIYSLYVMFFPQLIAGPIERPQNMLHQFYEKHIFDYDKIKSGLKIFMWGLFKKVVIADRLSVVVNQVYNLPNSANGLAVVIATVFYAFQIYCDFSGYSDMALGIARILGYKLSINFNRPYFSKSTSEFWKRWHISLSTWFRDYLYIPLGGNRISNLMTYKNIFITFVISGLWHGASWTYIVWGGINGVYLIIEQFKKKLFKKTGRTNGLRDIGFTFSLICFSWIFFRANSISDAFLLLNRLCKGWGDLGHNILIRKWKIISDGTFMGIDLGVSTTFFFYLCAIVCFLIAVERYVETPGEFSLINFKYRPLRLVSYYVFIVFIIMCGMIKTENRFIYFQF